MSHYEEACALIMVEAFTSASIEYPSCGCTDGAEPHEPSDRGFICPHDPRGMSEVELLMRDYRANLLSQMYAKEELPEKVQRASHLARIQKVLDKEQASKNTGSAIYVVTVLKRTEWDRVPDKHIKRDRTWGWYASSEDAERDIINNATDMFEEGFYDFAVVEEVPEGIAPMCKVVQWYFADYAESRQTYVIPKVSRIDEPEWSKEICNWGIG